MESAQVIDLVDRRPVEECLMSGDEGVVTYTVKELLLQFSAQLSRIEDKVDDRATRKDLEEVRAEVREATAELHADVRAVTSDVDDLKAWRQRVVGVAIGSALGGGLAGGGIVGVLLRAFGHG